MVLKPRFGDLTWTTPQKFWSDFVTSCFPYQIETLGKVSILILMGRVSALNRVIWVYSDTWTDPDFRVRFNVTVLPTASTVSLDSRLSYQKETKIDSL